MRNKKIWNIMLFLILILAVMPGAASAQEGETYINLGRGHAYHLSVGDNVVFGWGWTTATRGLVQSAVNSVVFSWTLRDPSGAIIAEYQSEGRQGWGEFFQVQLLEQYNCLGKWASGDEFGWRKEWAQDPQITFDEPGNYTLYFKYDFRSPKRDLCDINGDGKMDVYYGKSNTISIIVEE